MVGFLIATHGKLADGLKDSVDLIMGVQENFDTISILRETSIEEFGEDLKNKIIDLDSGKGVIVFTDLLLASPFNKAASNYPIIGDKHNYKILAGTNLPMVLEAFSSRMSGKDLDEIVEDAYNAGKEGIAEFFRHMEKMTGGGESFKIK